MAFPLVAVPNVSEGRSAETIEAVGAAFANAAVLLDVHSDPDHNRSVYTLTAADGPLVEALLAGIAEARDRIDLRRHHGVHPRVGAADVVPLVAVAEDDLPRATATALELAARIGDELELPVLLYGNVAPRRGPASFRRGGLDELERRFESGELVPDFGPAKIHPTAGCVIVGARRPLIAFNVDLDSADVEVARAVAAAVRETGGGLAGVRALGLPLGSRGIVQVSMNVEDWRAAPLSEVFTRVEREAAARGVGIAGVELVGLVPEGAALEAEAVGLRIPGVSTRILERRLAEIPRVMLDP